MLCNKDTCCPVCRALCCVFNESDTCMKFTPSDAPGYDCPDFLHKKEENKKPYYRIYPEMVRLRNASLPAPILVVDDFD